jgi:hypothetical protein
MLPVIVALLLMMVFAPAALAQGPGGDQVLVGQNFVLERGETLDGDLTLLGGNAELQPDSVVTGNVAVAGGSLQVDGRVLGDAVIFGGSMVLGESAVVEGNVATVGGTVTRIPGSVVGGETFSGRLPPEFPWPAPRPRVLPVPEPPRQQFWHFVLWPLQAVGGALLAAALSALIVLIAPRATIRVADTASTQTALSFVVGLLTMVVAALVGLVLLIACCLGLFVWLATVVALIFGWAAIAWWLGGAIFRLLQVRDGAVLLQVVVGAFVVTFLSRLPFCVGGLIGIVVGAIGLGAVILTRFGTRAYPPAPPSEALSLDSTPADDALQLTDGSADH